MKRIIKCMIFLLINLLKIKMEIIIKMYRRSNFKMDLNMKVNYLKIEDKVKVYIIIKMEICTWEIGKMINFMAKEFIYFQKEIDMKENYEMVWKKVMVIIIILMVINMKECGNRIKNKEEVHIHIY